ncbi:MAG: YARHG domain-containing protein [Alphaproteobacteria bacterium]
MLRRNLALVMVGLLGVSAAEALADDSCPMALNGICEEVYLGPGYCYPATDSTDCADAYLLPASDVSPLEERDVRYLTDYALRLARNEIFARHGYTFNSADLQAFFGARSWYSPAGQSVSLSPVEQANVEFLRRVEDGAVDRSGLRTHPADGRSLPPWTAWQAEVVHADGRVEAGIVDGVRGRVTDLETLRTVVVRVDMQDALYYGEEDEYGVAVWWGLFPPVLIEPFVQGLEIVPQPLGRETLLGEKVTRVRLDWESEGGYETLHGEAWLTDDGIFLKVAVEGVFAECCGGDENIPWRLDYQLEDLQRGPTDPTLMEPPPFHQWTYAG